MANVKQAVPFFGVTDMEQSLRFYVEKLGFQMRRWWIPGKEEHYPSEQKIRWCWLELGAAAVMLQEFAPGRGPTGPLGTGVSVCFQCEDAIALYREFRSREVEIQNRPIVGNGMWVVGLRDPDGYRIEFESPTDAPEESIFSED